MILGTAKANACIMAKPRLLFILLLLSLSCVKNSEILSEDISAEEKKWRDQGIEDYEFTLQISCFCIREYTLPKRIVVENNQVISVDGTPFEELNDSSFRTIDGFFNYIRETRERNPEEENITYDPKLGYPTYIYFDISYSIADEEIGYTISDLSF